MKLQYFYQWEIARKYIIVLCTITSLFSANYFIFFKREQQNFFQIEVAVSKLWQELIVKKNKSNLLSYQDQLEKITEYYFDLLRQVATKKEVADIVENISRIAKNLDLTIEYFLPLKEKKRSFYTVLPIKMVMVGNYQQLINFFSLLAPFKRLVIINHYELIRANKADENTLIQMNAIAEILINKP